MATNSKDIGLFLEEAAKAGKPIAYTDVVNNFRDLPDMNGAWLSHPLCYIFGELDEEDYAKGRPFRTAVVIARERNMPGPGFFGTVSRLRGCKLKEAEHLQIWIKEAAVLDNHLR